MALGVSESISRPWQSTKVKIRKKRPSKNPPVSLRSSHTSSVVAARAVSRKERVLPAFRNSLNQPSYIEAAIPLRRQGLAMQPAAHARLQATRESSPPTRIAAMWSGEYPCSTRLPAFCLGPDICFVFGPLGNDEAVVLLSQIYSICPKGADEWQFYRIELEFWPRHCSLYQ